MEPQDHLHAVGELVETLRDLGFEAILVGGMALVTLGSRRVTRDFDFLMTDPGERIGELLAVFYDRGLELASRLDDNGDVTSTIDNARIAGIRFRIDRPTAAFFVHPGTRLRVDLLFDFPLPAQPIAARARILRVASHRLRVAAEPDLLALKRLALANRRFPGDADDVAFLEARIRKRTRRR